MNKVILKIVSSLVVFVNLFYFQAPVNAYEREDKLAGRTRFQQYHSAQKNAGLLPQEAFPTSMPVFTNAMEALNKVITDPAKTPDDIKAVIEQQNTLLRPIGVTIFKELNPTKIGLQDAQYVILGYGEGDKAQYRALYFLKDYAVWSDDELKEIGVTKPEDKDNLKIPGVAGSWITKAPERERGLAAGDDTVKEYDRFIDLVIADILSNMLDKDEKRLVLRRHNKDIDEHKLTLIRSKIERRLEAIGVAVRETIFELTVCNVVEGSRLPSDPKKNYFNNPKATGYPSYIRAMIADIPQPKITTGDQIAELLYDLVIKVLTDDKKIRIRGDLHVQKRRGRETYTFYSVDESRMVRGMIVSNILGNTNLGRFIYSIDDDKERQVVVDELMDQMIYSLLADPDVYVGNIDEKAGGMLEGIKRIAGSFGFSSFSLERHPTRIMEVRFVQKHDMRTRRSLWKVKAAGALVVFEEAVRRLTALEDVMGTAFVEEIVKSVLAAEKARVECGADILNDPILSARLSEDDLFDKYAKIFSYIAMLTTELKAGGEKLDLKEGWTSAAAQFFWFSSIYGNPSVDLVGTMTMDENTFSRLVAERLRGIIPTDLILVNRILKKYFDIELPQGKDLAQLIHDNIVKEVWAVHNRYIDALGEKAGEFLGEGKERGLAAGEETAATAGTLQEQLGIPADAEQVVIDDKQWRNVFSYRTNPATGELVALSEKSINPGFLPPELKGLQVVFTAKTHGDWSETILKGAEVIRDNPAEIKASNAVRAIGNGFALIVDKDGIIYLLPEEGVNANELNNSGKIASAVVSLTDKAVKAQTAAKIKGFIDIDMKLLQIPDPIYQDVLVNELRQIYSEGLNVVRIINPAEITNPEVSAVMGLFVKRAVETEWQAVQSTPENTVSLVSALNTGLPEMKGTVIKLDTQSFVPQITPGLTIARRIISVGGEGNVTGDILADIKALYLSLVPQDLAEAVKKAGTIRQLLNIILPPINPNMLRAVEHMLLGNRVAGAAA